MCDLTFTLTTPKFIMCVCICLKCISTLKEHTGITFFEIYQLVVGGGDQGVGGWEPSREEAVGLAWGAGPTPTC